MNVTMPFKGTVRECMEMRLNLKEGTYNTLYNVILRVNVASPSSITFTFYPFCRLIKIGYGKGLIFVKKDL